MSDPEARASSAKKGLPRQFWLLIAGKLVLIAAIVLFVLWKLHVFG